MFKAFDQDEMTKEVSRGKEEKGVKTSHEAFRCYGVGELNEAAKEAKKWWPGR